MAWKPHPTTVTHLKASRGQRAERTSGPATGRGFGPSSGRGRGGRFRPFPCRSSWKRKAQSLRCQVRKHRGDKKQGKDISVEVMDMHRIDYGLDCHDQPVRDA